MLDLNDSDIYNLFKHKTVALIGNSEALDNCNYGKLIDSHDVICRVNKGVLLTDKQKYGSRTDVLFYSNFQILSDDVIDALDTDVKIVLADPHSTHRLANRATYPITEEYYDHIKLISGYAGLPTDRRVQWPTNGLVAAYIILDQNPKKISLFGFDWNTNNTFYKKNYKKEKMHNWDLEEEFLRSQNKIQIMEME